MRAKHLVILLVLAVGLVALAVFSTRRERATAAPPQESRLILPDLAVNDIARLLIVNQADTTTVHKVDGIWRVAEKNDYPANFDRVRTVLIALSELKVGDQRQTTPASRSEFGLVEPEPAHPDATRVRLQAADGKELANLLLGKHHVRKAAAGSPYGGDYPDGRYVSPDNGITAYLVKQTLSDVTAAGMSWIDAELFNVDAAEFARIEIKSTTGEPVQLAANDGGPLSLADVGAQEEVDEDKLTSLRNALAYLNLQDVADTNQSDAALGFDAPTAFTAATKDGRLFQIEIGGKAQGEGRYLRCKVAFEQPAEPVPAAGETNALPVVDHTATRLAVDMLNRKLAGWTFIIPSYKAESMLVTRDQLVKPKAPDGAETTPTPPAGEPVIETPSVEATTNAPPAAEPPARAETETPPTPPAEAPAAPEVTPDGAATNAPESEHTHEH